MEILTLAASARREKKKEFNSLHQSDSWLDAGSFNNFKCHSSSVRCDWEQEYATRHGSEKIRVDCQNHGTWCGIQSDRCFICIVSYGT